MHRRMVLILVSMEKRDSLLCSASKHKGIGHLLQQPPFGGRVTEISTGGQGLRRENWSGSLLSFFTRGKLWEHLFFS